MQNIIAVNFEVESEGYQAITTLSQTPVTDNYAILEMALVCNENDNLKIRDAFNSGVHTTDDTRRGGLIGGMIGILGGPIGILLGGSAGALTGSIIDSNDAKNAASMIETVAAKLHHDKVSLIILADEINEADLDVKLGTYKTDILRFDAAVIADQVEEAQEMQKEMERQTRMKLRAEKREDRKKSIEEKRTKISRDIENFKSKFKK